MSVYNEERDANRQDIPVYYPQPLYDIIDSENNDTYKYRNLKMLSRNVNSTQFALKEGSTTLSALPQYIQTQGDLMIRPEYTILRPFYTSEYLNRLSNAYLFDEVIHSCMERLSQFTLGVSDDFRSVLYPDTVRALKSELEAKNELKQIQVIKSGLDVAGSIVSNFLTDQEIQDFERFVHYVDKISKLGQHLKKNFRSSHVFGRSASYVEFAAKEIPSLGIPVGCPIALKPMKPMFLGNVVVDGDTWEIKAIELRDPKVDFDAYEDQQIQAALRSGLLDQNMDNGRYIDVDHLLYFVRNNNNTMLYDDDFWFGHSTLQTILPLSEENRRLNQIVIPALNQAHWAGTGIWHFPNWSARQMKSFLDKIKPGGHIAVPQQAITFQETKLSYDYDGILKLKDEIKKSILSVFGIPSFLMNFEDITNRATAEMVVVGFNESTIQAERSWIRDVLDNQWYSQLLKAYYPADEFIHIKLKIISEFDNISFESFMEKAVALSSLIDKNVVTITEARDIMNLPPLTLQGYQELGITPPATTLSGVQATQTGEVPGVNPVTASVPDLKTWLANKQQDPIFRQQQTTDTKTNAQLAQKFLAGKL